MDTQDSPPVELPQNFEDVDMNILIILVADLLVRVTQHNDQIPLRPEGLTHFHSHTPSPISILDYLQRIHRFSHIERASLLVTLIYVQLFAERMPAFTFSSLSCHRFLITSLSIATKALCDICSSHKLYAKVGGISVTELSILERDLLEGIDWKTMCRREFLQDFYVNLVRQHQSGRYYISGTVPQATGVVPSEPEATNVHPGPSINGVWTPPQPSIGQPTVEQSMAYNALQQSQK